MEELFERFLLAYARAVIDAVWQARREKTGNVVLGTVPGRSPDEDVFIGIDRICEDLFFQRLEGFCEERGIQVHVSSEHGERIVGAGGVTYLCFVDPFDGTWFFRTGYQVDWWSVLSFCDASYVPVAGVAVDLLNKRVYLAASGKVTEFLLEDGTSREVSPLKREGLNGQTQVAAYLMHEMYLVPWVQRVLPALQAGGVRRWYANGGSCVYPLLANGTTDAYVMLDEPRSEIDPGIAFAQMAGLVLVSVEPDGNVVLYSLKQEYEGDRVPVFIAATSMELAQDIASRIVAQGA